MLTLFEACEIADEYARAAIAVDSAWGHAVNAATAENCYELDRLVEEAERWRDSIPYAEEAFEALSAVEWQLQALEELYPSAPFF